MYAWYSSLYRPLDRPNACQLVRWRGPGLGVVSCRSSEIFTKNPQIVDPISNTNNLNALLKSLGLYPADTVGGSYDVSAPSPFLLIAFFSFFIPKPLTLASLDGNCLFRAISDQLFGSQSKHAELRREICNFIEDHKDDYAGFVEDPRGFDVHLKCMRQSGTSSIPTHMPIPFLVRPVSVRHPPVSHTPTPAFGSFWLVICTTVGYTIFY